MNKMKMRILYKTKFISNAHLSDVTNKMLAVNNVKHKKILSVFTILISFKIILSINIAVFYIIRNGRNNNHSLVTYSSSLMRVALSIGENRISMQ